ncbi:Protein TOXD [Cyphellophora attinorum]|uniref:Protein TOXD n=1 Tax=Cyphellophora attinorum TaxID=1664694 RepID=A0A0N1HK53_9EURO|nr:Protein TOXD [Phialophora attinorum]KPI37072.1 Protein TOXD [Phialophora attinorum]
MGSVETAMKNTALYLDAKATLSVLPDAEVYTPTGAQSLIRVKYSAINPADIRHHYMGMSSHVPGYEWLGTVVSVGPSSPYKPGQNLFGLATPGNKRPLHAGAHQDFLLAEKNWTLAAAAGTSIDALFNCMGYAFAPAGLEGEDPTGVPLLVWGGSSALGQSGIQLAKAAGFSPIITTASARNHALLKELGADYCFDYNSPTVVEDVRKAVAATGKELTSVWDTIGGGTGFGEDMTREEIDALDFEKSTPAMAKRCCSDKLPLKLVNALFVEKDPGAWLFPNPYQLQTGEQLPGPEYLKNVEALFGNPDFERGDRLDVVRRWILKDGAKNWKPIKTKVVRGMDAAMEAIKAVYRGEAGGLKVVIEHPFADA